MLTGKAKEDFEKWYTKDLSKWGKVLNLDLFNQKPNIERNAYIIEWLDSVGIFVDSNIHNNKKFWCDVSYFEDDEELNSGSTIKGNNNEDLYFHNRNSAIKKGIIKANEIYNTTHV